MMTVPKSFAATSCGICLLLAVIDPMLLSLFGCVIILVALTAPIEAIKQWQAP